MAIPRRFAIELVVFIGCFVVALAAKPFIDPPGGLGLDAIVTAFIIAMLFYIPVGIGRLTITAVRRLSSR